MQGSQDTSVLIVHDKPDSYLPELQKRFPRVTFETCLEPATLESALAHFRPNIIFSVKCPGIPGPVHAPLMSTESVNWVQVGGAGIDHLPAWDQKRLTVTNCSGVLSGFLAETVIGAILMMNFGFPVYLRQQRAKLWQQNPWQTVSEKTLLVVGLGSIGRQVALRARALGMRVIGASRRTHAQPFVHDVLPLQGLIEGLRKADFVTLHVPMNAATRHLIGEEELAAMKPQGYLINTSRGGVVDETALIACLESHGIAGAYLDVFQAEPLPQESTLWTLDNVVLTPHVSDTVEDWAKRYAAFFAENLERWLGGAHLENLVSPKTNTQSQPTPAPGY